MVYKLAETEERSGSQMTSFKRRNRFKRLWKVDLTPPVSHGGQQRVCWGVRGRQSFTLELEAHLPPATAGPEKRSQHPMVFPPHP